ncbi:MAG: STAS domain-containing protein [Ignavibacteriaceae bacterium]|jgi:anti-anti-sigma factor
MYFTKEDFDDVVVEVVDIPRATVNEAEEFKLRLREDIDNGHKHIVADLSACEFIDSTFLGTLVITLKNITSIGGDLRLVGFQPAVHSMFELTRMYRAFETFKTKEDAIKSFR